MLVRMREGVQPSGAVQEFVECLSGYPTTALAVIDVEVDGHGEFGGHRIDALLFTRYGPIVVDVCGFRQRQSGNLTISPQAWTVGAGAAELAEAGDPLDRVEPAMDAVEVALRRAGLDPGYICGAAVLVPFRGAVVRPGRTNLRPGLDVVVGNTSDATELRIYLEGFSEGPKNWTTSRVLGACTALGLAKSAPSRDELTADGFEETAPEPVSIITPPLEPEQGLAPPPGMPSRGQSMVGWVVLAVAVVGMLAVIGVMVAAWAHDAKHPDQVETTQPSPTPSPPPYRPTECWPLQQGC